MGVVYRAHDQQLDEVVALKVLRPDVLQGRPDAARALQAGDQAGPQDHPPERAAHPRLRRGGRHALHLDGVPRGRDAQGPDPEQGRAARGRGPARSPSRCARGSTRRTAQGVVHRDIKPQNMLILPETGELKIMDFGIARRLRGARRRPRASPPAGTVMGTPDYMPPEQAQGQPADFRSDIYSLGVVLFEIFTGKLPFDGRHGDGGRPGPHPEAAAAAAQREPRVCRRTWRRSSCAAWRRTPRSATRRWPTS